MLENGTYIDNPLDDSRHSLSLREAADPMHLGGRYTCLDAVVKQVYVHCEAEESRLLVASDDGVRPVSILQYLWDYIGWNLVDMAKLKYSITLLHPVCPHSVARLRV